MQILNGKVVANKRPRIVNEWLWADHFDITPPGVVPVAPTDTNASRIYVDPATFKLKIKKTNSTVVDIENVDIPDSALSQITNKAKLHSQIAYKDENTWLTNAMVSASAAIAYSKLTLTNSIVDGDIAAHTSTKITITAKGQLNSNTLYKDEDNLLGDHFLEFGDIAVPGNPAAGFRRLFVDTGTGQLSVRTNAGLTISLEAGAAGAALDALGDVVVPTPTTNDVLTFNGTNWVNAVPPGASGGEANTVTNIGSGGIGIFKQKVGVDLKLKKINAGSNKVTITDDTGNDEVDIDIAQANMDLEAIGGTIVTRSKLPSQLVYLDATHTFTTDQSFVSTTLRLKDVNNTYSYIFAGLDPGADRIVTLPALTANDAFVFAAHPVALLNKTIDVTLNTLTNVANTHISASAAIAWSKIDKATSVISDLSNVLANGAISGQVLKHDGTNWINQEMVQTTIVFPEQTSVPANPAAGFASLYYKQIDANNGGWFAKVERAGAFVEIRLA